MSKLAGENNLAREVKKFRNIRLNLRDEEKQA